MEKFLKENRKFWSHFKIKDNGKKILVEEPGWPMILHTNAIFTMIVNQAKGYTPVWLCGKNLQVYQILRSYFPNVKIISAEKKWFFKKLYAIIVAFLKFIKILFSKDIIGLHYKGVKYGDIVYDTYLAENKVATIRKIDLKILKIISKCIFRHIKIKNILQSGNYAAVLVSHQQGICSAVMLRTALRYGYQGYLHTGHNQATLRCFQGLKDIEYPHKPSLSDIMQIMNQLGSKLNEAFSEILKKEMAGKGSVDGLSAFSKKNKYYTNRTDFNKDYGLNPNKKNVFIMLHSFNDCPHSTFNWMLFKDYYDWLVQTIEFAKKNNRVNWVFKQHPFIKYYVTNDVDFNKLFSNCPNNIVYIDEQKQIDTGSLVYCADAIVTCLGSAGFELPAIGAIPSITAGDNPYTGLGFALEPKTKKEYFEILNNIDTTDKLPVEAQNRAKIAYIYIYKLSRINLSACPNLSFSQLKDKGMKVWYWDKVCEQYSTKESDILKELNDYILAVSKPEFKRLTGKI